MPTRHTYAANGNGSNLIGNGLILARVARKGRHVKPGQALAVLIGKARREGACTLRARIHFGPNGVLRALGPDGEGPIVSLPDALGLENLIRSAEQGAPQAADHNERLAERMGFPTYAALWACLSAQLKSPTKRTMREVIGCAANG